MVDYAFYRDIWCGEVSQQEFAALEHRAASQLERYKRIYCVKPRDEESERRAVCAMLDAMHYFDTVQNGGLAQKVQLGSLQVERMNNSVPDLSEEAKSRELYRCASLYLEIYRGVMGCCE